MCEAGAIPGQLGWSGLLLACPLMDCPEMHKQGKKYKGREASKPWGSGEDAGLAHATLWEQNGATGHGAGWKHCSDPLP